MNAYEVFASVYDELMDNIPYDDWCAYIIQVLQKYRVKDGLVCELGCGTGEVTERLADAGYDMIGIDNSYDMLEIANDKKIETGHESILYLMQDMREFELFGTVNAIVCVCDSINYLTELSDITHVFRLANNYLEARGIFVCDFKTRHYFKDVVADSTIAEDREDVSFIWDNFYDSENDINELTLSLFLPEVDEAEESDETFDPDDDNEDNEAYSDSCSATSDHTESCHSASASDNEAFPLYRKYQEFHYQRGLTIDDMKKCVQDSGMELVALYDAFTWEPATDKSERIYVVARETHQDNKHYE